MSTRKYLSYFLRNSENFPSGLILWYRRMPDGTFGKHVSHPAIPGVVSHNTFNNVGFGLKPFASDIEPFWEKSS